LGLPEEEIGHLNFKEYDVLLKRKQMADDRQRLNAGFIWAAIHNTAYGDPDREAKQPTDIVPSMNKEEPLPDLTKMTPEQQKYYIFRTFQGAGKRNMR
jgi:hypothetical protein